MYGEVLSISGTPILQSHVNTNLYVAICHVSCRNKFSKTSGLQDFSVKILNPENI